MKLFRMLVAYLCLGLVVSASVGIYDICIAIHDSQQQVAET
jgi:hypothetical protein